MASRIPPAARLLLTSALLVAMLLEACSAASSLSSFWRRELPGAAMPAAFERLASPLSAPRTRRYLAALQAGAALTDDFCSAAAVYCPSEATVSGPQPRACVPPFLYAYGVLPCSDGSASAMASAADSSAAAMFFSPHSLSPGKAVKLPDTANDLHGRRFLPHSLAMALPELSEQSMPALAKLFGVGARADMELAMKPSLAHCGSKSEHELKACHTSGESMISFISAAVGHDAAVYAAPAAAAMQEATVVDMSVVSPKGSKVASCHDMQFPSLLYSCHMTQTSELIEVTLKLADGKTVHMPAICHTDTRYWNPSHMAFQVLKVEPGKGSVCHWFPENSFIFAPPAN